MRRIAVAALVALLLAGCGSSKTHGGTTTAPKTAAQRAYNQRMAAIAPSLQSKIFKLRLALEQVKTPVVAQRQLRHLETTIGRGIAELTALKPPPDVAAAHARLIAAYRSLKAEFNRALTPLVRKRTSDAARVEAGRLVRAPAFREIGDALHAIIAKGYDLGFPPGS
jgi:hypothetical protein